MPGFAAASQKKEHAERELRLANRRQRNEVDDILKASEASDVIESNILNNETISEELMVLDLDYIANIQLDIEHQLPSESKTE